MKKKIEQASKSFVVKYPFEYARYVQDGFIAGAEWALNQMNRSQSIEYGEEDDCLMQI